MKDITVALELTLPRSVSDQQIKSFVETAIREKLDRDRETAVRSNPEMEDISVNEVTWATDKAGILGIDGYVIDVVAIADTTFTVQEIPFERENDFVQWRDIRNKRD